MQHSMARPISGTGCAVCLSAFAVVEGLAAEGALVDFPFCGAGEGHAVVLELVDGCCGSFGHVVDCVLVAEPVAAFDCVVHVPFPVVWGVLVKCCGRDGGEDSGGKLGGMKMQGGGELRDSIFTFCHIP